MGVARVMPTSGLYEIDEMPQRDSLQLGAARKFIAFICGTKRGIRYSVDPWVGVLGTLKGDRFTYPPFGPFPGILQPDLCKTPRKINTFCKNVHFAQALKGYT